MNATPPSPRKLRRALRLAGWNALLLIAGLALIGLAGEAWLRWTTPFVSKYRPLVFVPGVGMRHARASLGEALRPAGLRLRAARGHPGRGTQGLGSNCCIPWTLVYFMH